MQIHTVTLGIRVRKLQGTSADKNQFIPGSCWYSGAARLANVARGSLTEIAIDRGTAERRLRKLQ
jgi:hypothetical protein